VFQPRNSVWCVLHIGPTDSTPMNWLSAQEEFESWFKGKIHFVYQFEDAREIMGVTQSRKVFTKGQPSDYLVVSNGQVFFAEIKSSENPTSFPLANIKKSQWHTSIRVSAANGDYRFYIRKEPEHIWFKVPAAFFIHLQDAGIKSVKWESMEVYRYEHHA